MKKMVILLLVLKILKQKIRKERLWLIYLMHWALSLNPSTTNTQLGLFDFNKTDSTSRSCLETSIEAFRIISLMTFLTRILQDFL